MSSLSTPAGDREPEAVDTSLDPQAAVDGPGRADEGAPHGSEDISAASEPPRPTPGRTEAPEVSGVWGIHEERSFALGRGPETEPSVGSYR